LEPTTESKFCITYGQKLDPTDSIAEPLKKKNWFILHGWSYRRRRTCCQFTLTHKSQSTNNQKLDVEIQTNRKKTKIIHVETNTSHFTSSSVRGVQPYRLFFTPISLTWSVSCYFALNGSALILHTAIVVNAVWTRVLLQLFFPQCALCPIFLPFLDMFQVHVIHGLGMLQVLGGMRHATRPWHMLPAMLHGLLVLWVLITWEVMSAKHDNVKKKKKIRAKGQTEKKLLQYSLYWLHWHRWAFVKLGLKASLELLPQRNSECSPHIYLYPIHFYVRPGSCKICVTWGSGTFVGEEEWMLQKCARMLLSVCKSVHVQQHGKKKVHKKSGDEVE